MGLGILAVYCLIAISVLGFTGYYFYEYFDLVAPLILAGAVLLALIAAASKLSTVIGDKISLFTLNKWDLTGGEIAGFIFLAFLNITGLCIIGRSIIFGNSKDPFSAMEFGVVIILLGLIGGFVHFKEVKKSRKVRAVIDVVIDHKTTD